MHPKPFPGLEKATPPDQPSLDFAICQDINTALDTLIYLSGYLTASCRLMTCSLPYLVLHRKRRREAF